LSTAVLTSLPPPARGGGEGAEPTAFLWLQGTPAWLVNGTDFLDPATGRKFGTIEASGIVARKQVSPGQLLFLAGDPAGKSFDVITAKLDEAKVRAAVEKLK
jgi:hypothetical protein